MPFEKELEELHRRREAARAMGNPKRLEERAEAGILNARQRIAALVDPDSFTEYGLFAVSERAEDRHRTTGDGVVDGYARIDCRPVIVHAADFTAMGASSARIAGYKMQHSRRNAEKNGMPLVILNECSGARMPDIMGARGIHGTGYYFDLYRDRTSPWASAVLGLNYGGGTWHSVMSDFAVMRKGAVMAVSSDRVTSVAISEAADPEELGGWRMQTEVTGQIDMAVDSDEEALAAIRRFLSYLPSHAEELPPVAEAPPGADERIERLFEVFPDGRRKVYDVRDVIDLIFDPGSFFPLKERFAKVLVTGFARLGGQSVGVIATNPKFKGGALDPDACDKAINLLILCDSFNLPVITLADTPGFLVGVWGERRKLPGKIMNYVQALKHTTVPKLSVIMRKSYGQAHLNMGAGLCDEMACWFTADVSFMDPAASVNVIYQVREHEDPERYAELVKTVMRDTSGYDLAEGFMAQTVIDPRETRAWLKSMLELHSRAKRGGIGEHRLRTWPTTF